MPPVATGLVVGLLPSLQSRLPRLYIFPQTDAYLLQTDLACVVQTFFQNLYIFD